VKVDACARAMPLSVGSAPCVARGEARAATAQSAEGFGWNGVSWAGLEELEARVGVGPTMLDVFMMQERENENRARCCNAAVDCAI
jgi:hypothetical protein